MSYGGRSGLDREMFGGDAPEEAEPWSGFIGDYYRQPDDVVRGVSMAQGTPDVPGPAYPQAFADGDFYSRSDDTFRGMIGIGLDAFPGSSGPEAQLFHGSPDFFGKVPEPLGLMDPSLGIGQEPIGRLCPSVERFTEADVPPKAPSDPFFKFEATTLYLSTAAPHEIGNCLLDVLASQVSACVTKVNRKKFSIKASASHGNSTCSLKVRTYSQEQGSCAVEFQRRSGDRLAFRGVYGQAAEYLLRSFAATPGAPEAALEPLATPPVPPGPLGGDATAEIAPLLEMADLEESPELQAEAAAALAGLAQDGQATEGLCSTQAFVAFEKLLQSKRADVLHPMARLLERLAQRTEATGSFASGTLLTAVLGKVLDEPGTSPVSRQLAQALSLAVTRCASALPEKSAQGLAAALTEAVKDTAMGDGPVYRNLQEAQFALQLQRPGAFG
mmetsp:Transcript_28468/g.90721  ORF Transcript_28468/g.90721 Transcript_28468/m.90721 type:complete len:443 (+) Transcript_28468:178-1506(+)